MTTTHTFNSDCNARALDFLARSGAQSAVAFHEHGVVTAVWDALTEIGVSRRTDNFGNIIARIAGTDAEAHPPIALMARMDHPGFEIVGRVRDYLIGMALDGVPARAFAAGVPLHIVLPGGRRVTAETVGPHGEERERQVQIRLTGSPDEDVLIPSPAVFDLPDFSVVDDRLVMRAADDPVGCGCILTTLSALSGEPAAGDVYGVFTRAEEVGLVGAWLLAEARTLAEDTLVVSLESSRTLPGAVMGGGPVIRVGDAGSTFDSDAESALIRARADAAGAATRIPLPAPADERRSLRGQRVHGTRLPLHQRGIPPRQLPQRRRGRLHRRQVHPPGRLPGRRGAVHRGRAIGPHAVGYRLQPADTAGAGWDAGAAGRVIAEDSLRLKEAV